MARVGRLAGALLAETSGRYFLVGARKEPCGWKLAGFEEPTAEPDGIQTPFICLSTVGPVKLSVPTLGLDVEGEALARLLAAHFLIERTGLVSERLWRLVLGLNDELEVTSSELIDARWLGQLPPQIWQAVRAGVLKCS